jgi:hypothetical protein
MSNPILYNISEKEMKYSNDKEYRSSLRKVFGMKSPEDLSEDLDDISRDEQDFDMENTSRCLDYVYDSTCNNPYFQELYDSAAEKMISMDRSIGLSVLFSYDYFEGFHKCLCCYYEDPDGFNETSLEFIELKTKLTPRR